MEISKDVKIEMINYLRGLGDGSIIPEDANCGLCSNFIVKFGVDINVIVKIKDYPEYSGYPSYPIKSLNKHISEDHYYHNAKYMWKGKYGNARKHFCRWCADEIEKNL